MSLQKKTSNYKKPQKKALLMMDRSLRETGKFELQRHGCKHYSNKLNEEEIQNHTQQEGLQLVFIFSNLYLY